MKSLLTHIRSKRIIPILVIFYSVGVVGMILPSTRNLFMKLTPITLLLSTVLLFIYHDNYSRKFWIIAISIFLAGFFVEVLGVKTGILFGNYTYGDTLGLKLFNTPLMIGINWLMLVYCTLSIAGKYLQKGYYRAVIAAATMVVYDFALEPSAIYFNMWDWAGGAVPLQNYIAWFIIAFILCYSADFFGLQSKRNKIASPLFFIQLLFFIALDLWIFAEKIWD